MGNSCRQLPRTPPPSQPLSLDGGKSILDEKSQDFHSASERPSKTRSFWESVLKNYATGNFLQVPDEIPAEIRGDSLPSRSQPKMVLQPSGMCQTLPHDVLIKNHMGCQGFPDLPPGFPGVGNGKISIFSLQALGEKPVGIPPPKTLREARSCPWWPQYRKAAQIEFDGHQKSQTWKLVPKSSVPPGKTILRGKWVWDDKRDETGKLIKFKARFVACGYTQKYGIDYQDTYAGVMIGKSFRIMLAILNENSTPELVHWDIRQAFKKQKQNLRRNFICTSRSFSRTDPMTSSVNC